MAECGCRVDDTVATSAEVQSVPDRRALAALQRGCGGLRHALELLERIERARELADRETNEILDYQFQQGFPPEVDTERLAPPLASKSKQKRLFAEAFGTSRMTYRNKVRLVAACVFLAHDPDRKLDSVAAEVGYAHQSSFTKFFNREFGAAPTITRGSGADALLDVLEPLDSLLRIVMKGQYPGLRRSRSKMWLPVVAGSVTAPGRQP